MPYTLTKNGETAIVETEQRRDRYLRHGWQLVKPRKATKPAPRKEVVPPPPRKNLAPPADPKPESRSGEDAK